MFTFRTARLRTACFRKAWLAANMLFINLMMALPSAHAAPLLTCHIRQGETVTDLQLVPTDDPYSVQVLRINRFRFKPVVIGNADRVDYISLYTYYEKDDAGKLGLLHQVKYVAPLPQKDTEASSLTGDVYLYEPLLEREFSYNCSLHEVAK